MSRAHLIDDSKPPMIHLFQHTKLTFRAIMTKKWHFLTKNVALDQQNANLLSVRRFKHRTAFPKK